MRTGFQPGIRGTYDSVIASHGLRFKVSRLSTQSTADFTAAVERMFTDCTVRVEFNASTGHSSGNVGVGLKYYSNGTVAW